MDSSINYELYQRTYANFKNPCITKKKVMFAAPLIYFNYIVDDSLKAVKLKLFSNKFLSIWHINVNLHRILSNFFVLTVNLNLYWSWKTFELRTYCLCWVCLTSVNYGHCDFRARWRRISFRQLSTLQSILQGLFPWEWKKKCWIYGLILKTLRCCFSDSRGSLAFYVTALSEYVHLMFLRICLSCYCLKRTPLTVIRKQLKFMLWKFFWQNPWV